MLNKLLVYLVKTKNRSKYIHVDKYGNLYFENNSKIQTLIGTFKVVNIRSLKSMVKKVDVNQNKNVDLRLWIILILVNYRDY